MSVIYKENDCTLINHRRALYSYTRHDGEIVKYQLNEVLFKNFKRNQKEKLQKFGSEMNTLETFLTVCKKEKMFPLTDDANVDQLKKENIELVNKFYACSSDFGFFHGENNLNHSKIVTMNESSFIIPPKCKFFNKKVEELETCLPPNEDNQFDFIVVDPPWNNRYIKRVKKTTVGKQGYFMMTDEQICAIPLQKYLKQTSIVVIWCTNSDNHIRAIRENFLIKWHLKLLSTWKWVKIDKNGELFCAIDGNKKPFEQIFIATHRDNTKYDDVIENDCLIFSQPSSIHSHKPPLVGEKNLIRAQGKCLR